MKPIVCLLAAAFALAPSPLRAQTALDLHAAVAFALAHNATVLARRSTVAADEAQFAKYHAAEFPAIAGSLQNILQKSQNTSGTFSQVGLTPATTYSQNTAQIGATWNFYNGSLAQIQSQEAKRILEADRLTLRRTEQTIASDIATAFYGLAARTESVRLTAADQAYQNSLLTSARAQERVGRVAGVDVLRAQVNALRSQASATSAQADAANASESLAQQIGAPPDTAFAVPATLPEPSIPSTPLDQLVATAQNNRSDIASARANLSYARLTNAAIDTDRRPQISLSGAFGNQFSPTTTSFGLIPTTPTVRGNPGFWQIGATSTLSVPLIEYGSRLAAHRSARAAIDSASAALATAENGAAVDVRAALRAVQTAYANLQTSREAAALGAESARIAQLQYRNGLISLTDATAAEQSSLQAATDLVNARVTYVTSIVKLRVAVGSDDALTAIETSSK